MMMATFLAVAAGVLSALPLVIATSEPGSMLLLLLAPLPLFAAGLAQGVIGTAIAGGTVLLIAAMLAGLLAALGCLLFLVGPCLVLVRQALLNRTAAAGAGGASGAPDLEWYPSGLLVTWLTGIGLVWLGIAIAILSGEPAGLSGTIRELLVTSFSVLVPQLGQEQVNTLADRMVGIALGVGLVGNLLMLALNGVLAQGALVSFGRNLRPSPDLLDMDLPGWIAPALAVALAGAFLLSGDIGFVAKNLVPILLLPFFFAGLAVVHAFARRSQAGGALLVLFYALLLILTWLAAFVILLGLFDQWANIRRRLQAAATGQEEE